MKGYQLAFAIVRVNSSPSNDVRISVKSVIFDFAEVQQEVDRLNSLNQVKGCLYFWTPTRVKQPEPLSSGCNQEQEDQ